MPTYGSIERVQVYVGDIVDGRVFSVNTVPKTTQVTEILNDISAEINVHLKRAGYSVPVTTAASPNEKRFLDMEASKGAAAQVLKSLPGFSWTRPTEDQDAVNRINAYERDYRETLKAIDVRALGAAGLTASRSRIKVGSAETTAGDTKRPLFTRAMTDFPASRRLTT